MRSSKSIYVDFFFFFSMPVWVCSGSHTVAVAKMELPGELLAEPQLTVW
jgi:hypothetical protein